MAGSLTLALRTAQSGLLTNQEALNSVANNIANVNTPGYSRKVVNLQQNVVGGIGSGVEVAGITRKVDEGLLKSLRIESSTLNAFDARDPYYARLQDLFGTPEDNTSLSHIVAEFNNSVETLALNPANTLEQSEVMRKGEDVAMTLNNLSDSIQELRLQTDADIAQATVRITSLLDNIGTLNNELISGSAINVDVSDLRDSRDLAIDELSTLIDIRYYSRSDGDVVIFTESGRTLLDNTGATLNHPQSSAISATSSHSEGNISGIYVGATTTANDITNDIRDGKLKGLIDMRDSILPGLQSQLDEMAAQLSASVNLAHNSGAPHPGLQTATGTRTFIDGANQSIEFDGTSDTTIALMDSIGNQTATTTVRTLLGGNSGTIDTVASSMQTWLRNNGATGATVAVNADGKFAINMNTTTVNMVMRDETATADGSTAANATIKFDSNSAVPGVFEETVSGFSNFFGLNDFYVNNQGDEIHDTGILSSTYTLGSNTTLSFYNTVDTPAGAGMGTVNLTAGQTLDQMITAINDASVGVTASKVTDGSGFRLRLAESKGRDMVVTANNTFAADVGLKVAEVRSASTIAVRSDIVSTPGNISRGALQWDANKGAAGEYLMSAGDDTSIQALARALTATTQFDQAGGLTALNVNFTTYTTSIISFNSSAANNNQTGLDYQTSLTNSLQAKSDNFRGVNLDEEMTQLMIFEQAYGAAARIIASVQKMFDALEAVI
ncbi:MAG: flagellar hook-associated protein FlgK [Rhodospirillaceae bacterium]|nr:MAG: flagellar hook-associated protein FlgK [Rhodospirillaceae bacterium]